MSSPVVVLDIGASRIRCLVGETEASGDCKILGMGTSPCRGIRRSAVIDMPLVVESTRSAVAEAERSAGLRISGAYVGIAGQDVQAHASRSAVAISGSDPIDDEDVERALAAAEATAPPAQTMILHRFVQSYAVDGELVQNPLWLNGHKLEVETLSATASDHACTTLRRATEEAGVAIAGFLVESVATAASLLSTDERDMGVGLVDLGAGTYDMALYAGGSLRHLAEVPLGGQDITRDLSMVLNTSPREAEELKRNFGGVSTDAEEGGEPLTFETTAGRSHTIKREDLDAIIEARQQEMLEFVGREIESSGCGHLLATGLVFTGGGALLRNIDRFAEEILGLPVRIGVPSGIIAPESVQTPEFATGVGLLRFACDTGVDLRPSRDSGRRRARWVDRVARLFSFL